jgi:hypothetical protein
VTVSTNTLHTVSSLSLRILHLGNFHTQLLFRDDKELEIVREAVHRMVELALKLEGTCTS